MTTQQKKQRTVYLCGPIMDASVEARQRLRDAGWSDVQSALHNAVITSGITVSKHGAYAPTAAEVAAVKLADPSLN